MAEPGNQYDRSRFDVRVAVAGLAILSVVVVVVGAALWFLMQKFESELPSARTTAEMPALQTRPDGPKLQASPAAELAAMQARHREILTSTGWVDRRARIARIPVERAIDMLVRDGWPEGAP